MIDENSRHERLTNAVITALALTNPVSLVAIALLLMCLGIALAIAVPVIVVRFLLQPELAPELELPKLRLKNRLEPAEESFRSVPLGGKTSPIQGMVKKDEVSFPTEKLISAPKVDIVQTSLGMGPYGDTPDTAPTPKARKPRPKTPRTKTPAKQLVSAQASKPKVTKAKRKPAQKRSRKSVAK